VAQAPGLGRLVRRFRRFYDEEGKGNGKSPLAGGIGLKADRRRRGRRADLRGRREEGTGRHPLRRRGEDGEEVARVY
jgi:hypothetical protein